MVRSRSPPPLKNERGSNRIYITGCYPVSSKEVIYNFVFSLSGLFNFVVLFDCALSHTVFLLQVQMKMATDVNRRAEEERLKRLQLQVKVLFLDMYRYRYF